MHRMAASVPLGWQTDLEDLGKEADALEVNSGPWRRLMTGRAASHSMWKARGL